MTRRVTLRDILRVGLAAWRRSRSMSRAELLSEEANAAFRLQDDFDQIIEPAVKRLLSATGEGLFMVGDRRSDQSKE